MGPGRRAATGGRGATVTSEKGGFVWKFLLLLFCIAAAAVNTGNNILYLVLSIMVAAAAAAYAVTGRSLWRLEAALRLPAEAVAGRPFILGLEGRAPAGRLPTGWAEAALVGLPADVPPLRLPALAPGGRAVVSVTARALRRGIHEGIGLSLETRYPFGLFPRRRRAGGGASLVVTPRRRRIRSLAVETPVEEGAASSMKPGEGADLFNIREYRAEDDARRIDWKASARLDRPMLREFEREQERALQVVLDERPFEEGTRRRGAEQASGIEAFERLVETAASILDFCEEGGIRGSLLVPADGGSARALSGRSAMRHLAAVGRRPGAPAPALLGPPPRGVPRIVLSLDPSVATRVRFEMDGDQEAPGPGRPPGAAGAEAGA